MSGSRPQPTADRSAADRLAAKRERETRRAQVQASRPPRRRLALGEMPLLAVSAALGLVLIALGNNAAREAEGGLQPLFWVGLITIYAPIALRLLSSRPQREERIALVLTLGVSLFLVKVLRSPLEYVRFDEMGWLRATSDLISSGHAFGDNPINVATAGFPGLATVTAAISQLTGLSIFHAGLIVIGTARAVLMLALYLFLERVTRSQRAAGIGIAIYACNPSFLYFDAQFGYESLALMLGAALLLGTLRWSRLQAEDFSPAALGLGAVLLLLTCALTVTHHMSSLAVLAFMAIWTGAVALARRMPGQSAEVLARRGPGLPTAIMAAVMAAWFVFVAGAVTVDELGGVFSRSFESVADLILGESGSKQLFSGAGQNEHPAARILAVVSVVPLLGLIPAGLLIVWRDRVRDPLWWALTAVGSLYPVTLALRLTLASSETSQRASEFVFVGVAFLAALVSMRLQWPQWRGLAPALAKGSVLTLAVICFLGGFIIGELNATRQPGPYLVGAEDRSVTAEGLAAAEFVERHLPEGSRFHLDRTNATLLGAYGDVDPVFGRYGEVSIPRVLFSETFGRVERKVIAGQSLSYLLVDLRLARETPLIGYYVESDETGAFRRETPVSETALRKFETAPGVSRIYVNGPISIYDTSALLR